MSVKKFCAVSLTFLVLVSQAGCGSGGGSNSSAGGSSLSGSDSASGSGTSSTATTGGSTTTGDAAATGATAVTGGTAATAGTAVVGGPSLPDGTASAVGSTASGATAGGTTTVAPTGVAKLTWDVTPSVATGYKVYYGSSPKNYSSSIAVGMVPSFTVNLPPGTYYFAVTAYDSSGNESGYSNEVSKTI